MRFWEINTTVHERGLDLIKPGARCGDIACELNEIYISGSIVATAMVTLSDLSSLWTASRREIQINLFPKSLLIIRRNIWIAHTAELTILWHVTTLTYEFIEGQERYMGDKTWQIHLYDSYGI